MKNLILVLTLAISLAACGGSDSGTSSSAACTNTTILGTWLGTVSGNSDTMVLSSSCNGTSSYCGSTFTFPNVTGSSGQVLITVTSKNGNSGCLPLGATSCAYAANSTTLMFNCGNSTLTYTKQ